VFRLLALLVLLGACSASKSSLVPAGDRRIEWVGRTQSLPSGAVRFAWSATQLRVRFHGSTLRAVIEDEPLPDETPQLDWLAVEVDGASKPKLALQRGRNEYTLASGLVEGSHLLTLTKRSEAEVGTVTVHGFLQDPDVKLLSPPARRSRRIEVIGDSISAGYGNENTTPGCGYLPSEEDATRTYAAVAARELEAELIVQAWSGKGVLRNYDLRDKEPMPALYGRVLPGDARSPRIARDYAPQVVVLNLGTNDFFLGIPDHAAFIAAYSRLIARVRSDSPSAKLVLVLSPMLTNDPPNRGVRDTLRAWLGELCDQQRARGANVVVLEQLYRPDEPWGCHAHPSVRSHARFGAELAALLRTQLGW
jgi:lysophospholipase L1-like esterase